MNEREQLFNPVVEQTNPEIDREAVLAMLPEGINKDTTTITRLHSSDPKSGLSGETFLVESGTDRFVLRHAETEEKADRYEYIYNQLGESHFLPRMIARRGSDVLLEYVEGRDCEFTDADAVAERIGRIAGEINHIPLRPEDRYDVDEKFGKALEYLQAQEFVSSDEYEQIQKYYGSLKGQIDIEISYDMSDIIPPNFRINNQDLRLVDIDAIKPLPKGRGIVKGFMRWLIESEQQEQFARGYNEVNTLEYFTETYRSWMEVFFLVISARNHHMRGPEASRKDLVKLKELIAHV